MGQKWAWGWESALEVQLSPVALAGHWVLVLVGWQSVLWGLVLTVELGCQGWMWKVVQGDVAMGQVLESWGLLGLCPGPCAAFPQFRAECP